MSTLVLMLIMLGSFCGGVVIDRYPWFIPSPHGNDSNAIQMTRLNVSNQSATVQPGSRGRYADAGGEVGETIFDTERDLSCSNGDSVSVLLQCS